MAGLDQWSRKRLRVLPEGATFSLPKGHKPYMVLARGGTGPFSCANCTAHFTDAQGAHHCKSPQYVSWHGGTLLTEEDGTTPLDDPSRACSDWFTPSGGA